MTAKYRWERLSIRTKAVITQVAMIVVPVITCALLIVYQIMADSRNDTALASYQYCRYIIQVLDTSVRQVESMANTIASNIYVRSYATMLPGAERDAFYLKHVRPLLLYAYNRYLPTHDVQILPNTTLEDCKSDSQISYMRGTYRMWTFDNVESSQPQARFYYQFEDEASMPVVLLFTPSTNMLTDVAANIGSILKQTCAVYNIEGPLVYQSGDLSEGERSTLQALASEGTEGYTTLDNRKVGYCLRCETLPLLFVSTQQFGNALLHWRTLLPWVLLCAVLVVACVWVSYKSFFKGITQRVANLSHDCESLELDKLGKSNTQLTVPVRGRDEIGVLSESINNMLGRIAELTHINEREVMISQRVAYDMLAAQIHPHFIYNTLENLRMMAKINDDDQVADLLYALGRMLRLSISDASSVGEVRTEMEHVQLYLQLQSMRMNGNLTYELEPITEEIAQVRCPRFLLQPIVENAIKHGFQERKSPAHIKVSAGYYEKGVYLCVEDDGAGFTPERLQEIREALQQNKPISNTRGGIGLTNVSTRLRMFYGETAGLTLESTPERGTVCTLLLAISERSTPAASTDGNRWAFEQYTS